MSKGFCYKTLETYDLPNGNRKGYKDVRQHVQRSLPPGYNGPSGLYFGSQDIPVSITSETIQVWLRFQPLTATSGQCIANIVVSGPFSKTIECPGKGPPGPGTQPPKNFKNAPFQISNNNITNIRHT